MSQDSHSSDPNTTSAPSGEPPVNTPPGSLPPETAPAASVDADEVSPSAVATPPAPADELSTPNSESVDTAPSETSLAPVPMPPPQAPQYQNQQQQQPGLPVQVKARNPLLYALADFLITGLGLMVQGRVGLGITFLGINIVASLLWFIPFLGWILFFLVLLPVWITSMTMAFTTAKKWNRQHGIIS